MGANYAQAIIGLIVCLGLILVLASFAKKHQPKIEKLFSANLFTKVAERRLKTVERMMLAPGHTAVILQKDGVELLVILSPQSSQVVDPALLTPEANQA